MGFTSNNITMSIIYCPDPACGQVDTDYDAEHEDRHEEEVTNDKE